jgi:hypothetical protein
MAGLCGKFVLNMLTLLTVLDHFFFYWFSMQNNGFQDKISTMHITTLIRTLILFVPLPSLFLPTSPPGFSYPSSLPFRFMSFCLFVCFYESGFCMWERTYDICLSESGLFCLTQWSPVPSIFLQMICFHLASWLTNTPLCIDTIFSLSTHLVMRI